MINNIAVKDMLIIGPRYSDKLVGGVVVLFESLLSDLDRLNVDYMVFDSNSRNYRSRIIMYLRLLYVILTLKKNVTISLHGTATDFLYIGPVLFIRKVLFGNKYNLRKFAGNYDEIYESYRNHTKIVVDKVLKNSSVNFFETKKLVSYFCSMNRTLWFPNVRDSNGKIVDTNIQSCFKFVYLGQLRKSKGIQEAIDAVTLYNSLDSTIRLSLDIYGPVIDFDTSTLSEDRYDSISYKGVLKSSDVSSTLIKYNAMIFPTYYEGEGYPGVIIEAFSIGMPVISTDWRSIPELFIDEYLLTEVKNIDSICNAIRYLILNYNKCHNDAFASFEPFDSTRMTKKFLSEIS